MEKFRFGLFWCGVHKSLARLFISRLNLTFLEKKRIFRLVRETLADCEWCAASPGLKPLRLPRAPMPTSTAVTPDTYTGQGSVEARALALACHNLGASTTCEMTPPGHSQSTQPVHCDTTHAHHFCNC